MVAHARVVGDRYRFSAEKNSPGWRKTQAGDLALVSPTIKITGFVGNFIVVQDNWRIL